MNLSVLCRCCPARSEAILMRGCCLQIMVLVAGAVLSSTVLAGPAPVFELLPDGTKVRAGSAVKQQGIRPRHRLQDQRLRDSRVTVPGATQSGVPAKKVRVSRSAPRHSRPQIYRPKSPAATRNGLMHIVRRGDTLRRIARKYRVSVGYLIQVNHLKSPYRLYPGQSLIIVRRKASSAEIARLNYLLRKKNISPITYITSPRRVKRRLIGLKQNRKQNRTPNHSPQRHQRQKRTRKDSLNDDAYVRAYRTEHKNQGVPQQQRQRIGSEEERLLTEDENSVVRQKNDRNPVHRPTISQKRSTIRQNDWGNRTRRSKRRTSRKGRTAHGDGRENSRSLPRDKQQVAKLSRNFSRRRDSVIRSRLPRAAVFQRRRKVRWRWPTRGSIVKKYSKQTKGIDIAGHYGQSVSAAASGLVVYIGNSLIRYGNLVIIKHSKSYFSAYAHNQRLLVKKGQVVRSGQKIAEMGSTGTSRVKLHFEIRKDGKSVDPLRYLPRR